MPIPTESPIQSEKQTLSLRDIKNSYEIFKENTKNKLNTNKSDISLWLERWFLSSNAKDIGTLYLIFALLAGLVGTAFSVLIRLELSGPGVQFIADNQLYNSIITAHAIVMIFFMVETNANMLKINRLDFPKNTNNIGDKFDVIINVTRLIIHI